MAKKYDLIVIGGGSGGIAAAEKAASYGAKVAIVEMGRLGGTCVNLGCIPKKITWYAGDFANTFHYAGDYGFKLDKPEFNYEKLVKKRSNHIEDLNHGLEERLRKNHIVHLIGIGIFVDPHTVMVNGKKYTADFILIATGCHPTQADIKGAKYGIDSDRFFDLKQLPKSVAIIGGGYIATELASILTQLGSKVKVLLRKDKLLRNFDNMLSDSVMEIMRAQGVLFLPNYNATEITNENGKLVIHCATKPKVSDIDTVLFAIGREPRTTLLNLAAANIKTDKNGFISTNKWAATNVPHIYAIGDVTGKKALTPVAVAAGRKFAAKVFGGEKNAYLDYDNIPTVVFSHPPLGSIGFTEQEAVKKHGRANLTIYESKFNSLFYALSDKKMTSKIKLITLKKSGKVIGCHIVDPNADEILQGFGVAIKMGATKTDFDNVVAIHPTSAEELVTLKKNNILK